MIYKHNLQIIILFIMNDKLHCRENCRYHYSLLRDLIHNQVNKQHFIIRFIKQFILYLCVVLLINYYIQYIHASRICKQSKIFKFTVDQIQQIRNFINCNTTRPVCNTL